MEHPKFELYDIQKTLSIKTIFALQVTHTNINLLPTYLKGVFCEDYSLEDCSLHGDELRIKLKDEFVIIHPLEYLIIDERMNIIVMNERSFKYLFTRRVKQ